MVAGLAWPDPEINQQIGVRDTERCWILVHQKLNGLLHFSGCYSADAAATHSVCGVRWGSW